MAIDSEEAVSMQPDLTSVLSREEDRSSSETETLFLLAVVVVLSVLDSHLLLLLPLRWEKRLEKERWLPDTHTEADWMPLTVWTPWNLRGRDNNMRDGDVTPGTVTVTEQTKR